jgi:alkanesulfonate monooxygenase SsuD/methylene tetrahydromethanopterin reductase-like flavin-dependent oxidoreductase (luciferase family)
VDFGGTPSLKIFRRKSDVLERHCADVGRRFAEIVRVAHFGCLLAASGAELQRKRERLEAAGYRPDAATAALGGTPADVAAELARWRAAGCAYAVLYFADTIRGDGPALFMSQVAAHLAGG